MGRCAGEKKEAVYIKKNTVVSDLPKVKYRGIFINDEAPALSNWSREKFGGFNHKFYEKVFELILRLKGNYIWPAMWGNAFYYDDSLNIKSADEYGIVIGTSHHEPLMRAHEEWKYYGKGRKWNYDSTEAGLKEFWKGGMERAWNEKIVSVGMRGDGDEPMSRETATALLERIVKDQRQIIEEVTRQPASKTPQLWALYKEVQDYYDKGMRVPDDITLLYAMITGVTSENCQNLLIHRGKAAMAFIIILIMWVAPGIINGSTQTPFPGYGSKCTWPGNTMPGRYGS